MDQAGTQEIIAFLAFLQGHIDTLRDHINNMEGKAKLFS